MKNQFTKFIYALTIVICTMSNTLFAQWNWIPTPQWDRWGQTNNLGGTVNDIKAIGVGNFIDFNSHPDAALHVNTNFLTPTAGIGLFFGPGEVFRTDGPSTNLNAWRLFTGAGNGTEKGMIFNYGNNPTVADQTNFSLQASVSDMSFYTLPITANTVGTERMRIVGVNRWQGFPIFATVRAGNVGIGNTNPLSMLQIGGNSASGAGWRTWMDIGTLYASHEGFDNMYVGLDSTGTGDQWDAIINWGNNPSNTNDGDRLRFVFTAAPSNGTASSQNGLEIARMISNGNKGYVGIGDFNTAGFDPYAELTVTDNQFPSIAINNFLPFSSSLHMNFEFALALQPGYYSNLATIGDAVIRANGGATEDLIITTRNYNNGSIRLVTGNSSQEFERMTIRNQNDFGRIGINNSNPQNRLEITSITSDPSASGLRFSNLTASGPYGTANGYSLTVDANGDVILVPAGTGTGFGAACGSPNPYDLTSNWRVGLADNNLFLSDGTASDNIGNNIVIGPTCGYSPLAKLDVLQQPCTNNGYIGINVENKNYGVTNNSAIGIRSFVSGDNITSGNNIAGEFIVNGNSQNLHGAYNDVAGYFSTFSYSYYSNPNTCIGSPNLRDWAIFVPCNGGKVQIGGALSDNPNFTFSVYGTTASYNSNWSTLSDSILKTNINNYYEGLNVIRQIKPISYEYNGLADMPKGRTHIGIIAQQLAPIAPYMFDTVNVVLDTVSNIETPVLSYNADALAYMSINAIKQLDSITTDLSLHSVTQATNGCFISNENNIEFGTNLLKHDTKLPLNDFNLSFDDPIIPVHGKNLIIFGNTGGSTKAKFTFDNITENINCLFRSVKQTGITENIDVKADINFDSPGNKYAGYYSSFGSSDANFGLYTTAGKGKTNYGIYASVQTKYPIDVAGYFVGDVYSSGTFIGSDVMLKQNIVPITNAINIISQLQPKMFNFDTVNFARLNLPQGIQFGLVAQDVENVLPNIIKEVKQPATYDTLGNIIDSALTFKSLKYEAFIPILIQSVKELKSENDSMKNVITSYESRISSIENMLAQCCEQTKSAKTDVNATVKITTDPTLNNQTQLYQNRPNPFNVKTTFAYTLGEGGDVELIIEDSYGRLIANLVSQKQTMGDYSIEWNAENMTSGIYFYSLKVNGIVLVKKAIKF